MRVLVSVDAELIDPTMATIVAIDNAIDLMMARYPNAEIHGRCHRGGGGHQVIVWDGDFHSRETVELELC